jgi:hypothetical protein
LRNQCRGFTQNEVLLDELWGKDQAYSDRNHVTDYECGKNKAKGEQKGVQYPRVEYSCISRMARIWTPKMAGSHGLRDKTPKRQKSAKGPINGPESHSPSPPSDIFEKVSKNVISFRVEQNV